MRSLAPEMKALDIPRTNYALNTTAVITPLNLIQTGSTFCNRIGRKIEMVSVRINGYLTPIRTGGTQDYLRCMIIYDRQVNGAVPSISDILQTTDQATTNSTTSHSGINLNNRDRFLVVRDMRIVPPAVNVAGEVVGAVDPLCTVTNIDMYCKLKGLVTQYKADSAPAVIGDIASGALFLVTFGALAAGTESWLAPLEVRLRYMDI